MTFTKLEKEILLHRLESADCIAEALTDHCEGDEPASSYSSADIIERAEQIESIGLDCALESSELDMDILRECAEGSTFFGNIEDAVDFEEITRQKATAYYKAADTLGDKLGMQVATS